MPFQKSAKIEIVNQTGQEIYAFYYQIEYQKLEDPLPDNVAYFHAWWHRDLRTKSKDNYVILDAKGEGQFVGLNMSMQSYNGQLWYLEGDEMVYVDGEKKLRICLRSSIRSFTLSPEGFGGISTFVLRGS